MNDRNKTLPPCVFADTHATCSRCDQCPTRENAMPWYRQGWPWLLLTLPALALIACLITIVIAARHGDSLLRDDYFRDGLELRRESKRDRAASRLRLSADLDIDANGHIRLRLNNQDILPPQLKLQLLHAFDAGGDCETTLYRVADHYQGNPCAGGGRFIVEVRDLDTSWRLRGRIVLPLAQTLHLQP